MFLRKYPVFGITLPIGSSVASIIDVLEPILQAVALLVGIAVAVVTFLIKLEDLKSKRLENEQAEQRESN